MILEAIYEQDFLSCSGEGKQQGIAAQDVFAEADRVLK